MSEVTPTHKFKATLTTRGINNDALMPSLLMLVPVLLVFQLFMPPVMMLVSGVATWFFVIMPLLEYLQERVPPQFAVHTLLWLAAGKRLEVTRDPLPIPLVIEPEWEQARAQYRAEQSRQAKTPRASSQRRASTPQA